MNPSRLTFLLFSALFTVHSTSVEAAQAAPVADSHQAVVNTGVRDTQLTTTDLIRQAERYVRQGNHSQAEASYNQLIAWDVQNAELYIKRARLYLDMLDYEKAIADLKTAIFIAQKKAVQPSAMAVNLLAQAFLDSNEPAQALAVLEPYVQNNTATELMKETYITALQETSRHQEVIEAAKRWWPTAAQLPQAVGKAVAASYIDTGKAAAAQALYYTLLERQNNDPAIRAGLAYALICGGKTAAGLSLYTSLLQQNDNPDDFIQDAVKLFDQGNFVGGRSLFEKIIELFPNRPEYRQRYAAVLSSYHLDKTAQKQYGLLAAQIKPNQDQLQQEYEQALYLARQQQYEQAIAKFKWLRTVDPGNLKITFDYITVLCWSGNYSGAIGLYEGLPKGEVPAYVRRDVSGAYNRTGQYEKALAALQPLADQGDRQARLWQAEIWIKLGDKAKGNARYDELLAQDAKDATVYLSRGSYAFQAEDYRQAVWDFEQALRLIPSTATEQVRQIKEQLAAAYINIQQFKRALAILGPYMHSNWVVSPSMQGNYFLALKNDGQYALAALEAPRIWPEYSQAPVFGLRALAECYIKLKRNDEAIKIYQHLVQRAPDSEADQLVLGFRLMIEGKLVQSLAVYDQLLTNKPLSAPLVLGDAASLLATENYVYGKALFELVLRHFPDNAAYRQQYAKALDNSLLHQSAYNQYEILSRLPGYEVAGLTGMARASIAANDYAKARQALSSLKERYGRSKAVAAVSSQYDNRLRYDLESSYVVNSSYKQLRSTEWQTNATQNLGDNYLLLANWGRTRLDDFGAQESQVLLSRKMGLGYDNMAHSLRVWYGQDQAVEHFSTFSLSDNYYINDQFTLQLNLSRQPVNDVQALQPQNSGSDRTILAKSGSIGFTYTPSFKENMQFNWSRSLFTDDNHSTGYSLEHNYLLYDQNGQSLSRNLYWSRQYYAHQNSVYDCPEIRESLGLGWTWRNSIPSGYWLGRFVLNWDRDYPDKLALGPYLRLEYGHNFSREQSLTIGAEYGTRSHNLWGQGGLHYGYRQFDVLYHANW